MHCLCADEGVGTPEIHSLRNGLFGLPGTFVVSSFRNQIFMNTLPTTFFASPERYLPHELAAQAALFEEGLVPGLLNAMGEFVFILNDRRQILFANRRMLEMLDLDDCRPLVGLRMGELFGCEHSGDMPSGCGTTEHCRLCGFVDAILKAAEGEEAERDCRLTRRNGDSVESFEFRVKGSPFRHEGQNFSIAAVTDISHEKRRRALERIFFHDILNTVGGMRGIIRFMKDGLPDDFRQDAEVLDDAVSTLVDEIQLQRDLNAAEHGELEVRPSLLRAWDVLRSVKELASGYEAAEGRNIVLDDGSCRECLVSADFALLRRTLGNMVKNALEGSDAGGTVTLRCLIEGRDVVFSVHNAGVIPRDIQLQIFQRSFSTKGRGRGLGTYSIRMLSERYLGGKVWFVSREPAGTYFHLAIPQEVKLLDEKPSAN